MAALVARGLMSRSKLPHRKQYRCDRPDQVGLFEGDMEA